MKDLTYKISKYPKALSVEKVDREVKRAFAVWSEYTDLKFTQKPSGSVSTFAWFVIKNSIPCLNRNIIYINAYRTYYFCKVNKKQKGYHYLLWAH